MTAALFLAVESMSNGKVAASPHFDMLDGARAVEMGNPKLDTGLIALTPDDLAFDTCAAQNLATVASVMDAIFVSYMSWLSGLSLLVTVLSIRYVLDFLENYNAHPVVASVGFVNYRLHGSEFVRGHTYEENLVNIVLRGFVVGMCKHIGFCRSVGTSVLYDEEDLTTRSMDFDFLSQVTPEAAVAEIEKAEAWIATTGKLPSDALLGVCLKYLQFAKLLVRLEHLLVVQVKLFAATAVPIQCLASATDILHDLAAYTVTELPKGAVSRFVQLDCNNKHIPCANYSISREQAITSFNTFASCVQEFVDHLTSVQNVGQLDTLIRFTIGPNMTGEYPVIARGLLQLFLIRDDKSVAGLDESIGTISIRLMERFSTCGNSIFKPDEWNIQGKGNPEELRANSLTKVSQLIDDVENAMYQKLSACSNNRCRQRQLNNRNIVVWDLLQFNAERIEQEVHEIGIGDKLDPALVEPALGISLFVYHQKLEVMVDVALSGFEQHLYKPFEAADMFYYAAYLSQITYSHLTNRVQSVNEGKLASITALSKKLKKLKAGPKKDQLRRTIRHMEDVVAPQVRSNMAYIRQYVAPSNQALFMVCYAVSNAIEAMHSFSLLPTTDTDALVDRETLFNLRMKPWSSVGVPELPTFAMLEKRKKPYRVDAQSAAKVAGDIKTTFSRALKLCGDISAAISKRESQTIDGIDFNLADEIIYKGGENGVVEWFNALQKTCVAYQVEMGRLAKLAQASGNYKLVSRKGYHVYFPIYSLEQK